MCHDAHVLDAASLPLAVPSGCGTHEAGWKAALMRLRRPGSPSEAIAAEARRVGDCLLCERCKRNPRTREATNGPFLRAPLPCRQCPRYTTMATPKRAEQSDVFKSFMTQPLHGQTLKQGDIPEVCAQRRPRSELTRID